MRRGLSLAQYRAIDLFCFSLLLVFTQVLIVLAASSWFSDQLFIVSPVAVVVSIVMMRWGAWAAIPAVVGGIAFCLVSGGTVQHLLIYSVGNLLSMVSLLFLKRFSKQRVRESTYLSLALGLCVQLLMLLGRAAVCVALGEGWEAGLGFVTTDFLSVVFTLVIVWIARRVDGLFEDQLHYLRRIQKEMQSEGGKST